MLLSGNVYLIVPDDLKHLIGIFFTLSADYPKADFSFYRYRGFWSANAEEGSRCLVQA